MSGHKRATVKISEEEYRRLHEADRELRRREKEAKPAAAPVDMSRTFEQMEERQRQLEQALFELDEDLGSMSSGLMQDILAENALFYQSLAGMLDETSSGAGAYLECLSDQLGDEIQRERDERQRQLQVILERVEVHEGREGARADAARRWLHRSAALAELIQQQFDHERFLPGALARILEALSFAQENLAQGFCESSLQMSQQAFLGLSGLRFDLEQLTLEWQTEYAKAQRALAEFIDELVTTPGVRAFGLQGEELAERVDLAFWSNGAYQELVNRSRQLLHILAQEQGSLSTEELRRVNAEMIPLVTRKFESIIYEARLRALNSQLRMNIAEKALEALEVQGFRLDSSGYADGDMRSAFTAHLENTDGSRVQIEVLPAERSQQELTNELVVITNHPYLKTEHEARLQWQELCRILNAYDLQVSQPEVRAAPPLPAARPAEPPAVLPGPPNRPKRHHHVR